jgi:hypothetical protein
VDSQAVDSVSSLLKDTRSLGIRQAVRLLRSVGGWKGVKELRRSRQKVRADERILGGSEFVERGLRESEEV